jgi:hypothetical protein
MIAAVEASVDVSPFACRARATDFFSGDAMVRGYEAVYRAVLTSPVTRHLELVSR